MAGQEREGDEMTVIAQGSRVTLSYIGTLDNGRIFHSTEEAGPLIFTVGNDEVFAALERAVLGLKAGEARNVVIPAEEAYGPRRGENIISVARQAFPGDGEIAVGRRVSIEFSGGVSRVMLVTAVSETEVTLDGNHPLAGCDLTFALRVDAVEGP